LTYKTTTNDKKQDMDTIDKEYKYKTTKQLSVEMTNFYQSTRNTNKPNGLEETPKESDGFNSRSSTISVENQQTESGLQMKNTNFKESSNFIGTTQSKHANTILINSETEKTSQDISEHITAIQKQTKEAKSPTVKMNKGTQSESWTEEPTETFNTDKLTSKFMLEIDVDPDIATDIVQELTSSSSRTTPCVCPSTSGTSTPTGTLPTTSGFVTPSGECVCPDIASNLAEEETSTNMPETNGRRRRRREMEEMDLYVDDFDQKILKKMPFLKFY